MGGGLLLRGVAKTAAKPSFITAGLAAAAGASTSSAPPASSSSSARCVMMQSLPSSATALRLAAAAADDWELAGDEERLEPSIRDHLVFGAPPSKDEVAEATSDLQNVFGMYAEDLSPPSPESLAHPFHASPARSHSSEVSSVHFGHPLDWVEPHLVSHAPGGVVQVRRRNEVAEAFRLLQNDPVVQGVVMSIASDKAVWEAVLGNEKVKEFRKKLSEQDGEEAKPGDEKTGLKKHEAGVGNLFASLLDYFGHLKVAFREMISSLLEFADKKFFSDKDGDFIDRALKSCFMLGVMVVSVVVVKRAAVA